LIKIGLLLTETLGRYFPSHVNMKLAL